MKHLGDITKIHGWDIEQVDVVCGGSPCQNLSQAGNRMGLAGEESKLFHEQIRILREMKADADARISANEYIRHPLRWGIWENVQGAFSSNGGEDFRCVLESFCQIIEPAVSIPRPQNGKWAHAGLILLNGGSVAWRLHDSQYWGETTPQRRKRVSVVADFRGECAGEVLFERKGSGRDFAESGAPGQDPTDCAKGSTGTAGCDLYNGTVTGDVAATLSTGNAYGPAHSGPSVLQPVVLESNQDHATITNDGITPTLTASMGMGGGYVPMVTEPVVYDECKLMTPVNVQNRKHGDPSPTLCKDNAGRMISVVYGIDRAAFNQGENAQFDFKVEEELSAPLLAVDPNAVGICETYQKVTGPLMANSHPGSYSGQDAYQDLLVANTHSIVRRLTPLECERLQGFPDGWTHIGDWVDSKGKLHKGDSDSPRYRALGNSICTSFWKVLAKRISAQYDHDIHMGSLFDGIGGVPYVFEAVNGKGTARWASEIEEFPIAVTRIRFPEE